MKKDEFARSRQTFSWILKKNKTFLAKATSSLPHTNTTMKKVPPVNAQLILFWMNIQTIAALLCKSLIRIAVMDYTKFNKSVVFDSLPSHKHQSSFWRGCVCFHCNWSIFQKRCVYFQCACLRGVWCGRAIWNNSREDAEFSKTPWSKRYYKPGNESMSWLCEFVTKYQNVSCHTFCWCRHAVFMFLSSNKATFVSINPFRNAKDKSLFSTIVTSVLSSECSWCASPLILWKTNMVTSL